MTVRIAIHGNAFSLDASLAKCRAAEYAEVFLYIQRLCAVWRYRDQSLCITKIIHRSWIILFVLIEPADDVFDLSQPVTWAAANSVRLTRHANQHAFDIQ